MIIVKIWSENTIETEKYLESNGYGKSRRIFNTSYYVCEHCGKYLFDTTIIIPKQKYSRIRFGFKSKHQLPLFMIWKEYYVDGEMETAKVLFMIRGKEVRKLNKQLISNN